ncbi:hypothetical protein J6590_055415 [Homalodisca vitripennis]|nr:hypothetical protein J6590_055415 [Homalodisca vitripennis]
MTKNEGSREREVSIPPYNSNGLTISSAILRAGGSLDGSKTGYCLYVGDIIKEMAN